MITANHNLRWAATIHCFPSPINELSPKGTHGYKNNTGLIGFFLCWNSRPGRFESKLAVILKHLYLFVNMMRSILWKHRCCFNEIILFDIVLICWSICQYKWTHYPWKGKLCLWIWRLFVRFSFDWNMTITLSCVAGLLLFLLLLLFCFVLF